MPGSRPCCSGEKRHASREATLAAPFERWLSAAPDIPAIWLEDEPAVTPRELDAAATVLSEAIDAHTANGTGRVAIRMPNHPLVAAALIGIWRLRRTAVMLSPLYTHSEAVVALDNVGADVVVELQPDGPVDRWAKTALGAVALSDWQCAADASPRSSGEEALVLFTGGTTGRPKAVAISHERQAEALRRLIWSDRGASFSPSPDGPASFVMLPLFHSGGLQLLLLAWHVGRAAVLFRKFDAGKLQELLLKHRPRHLMLLPTMLYDLVASPEVALPGLRYVITGGQRLDHELRRRFTDRFGIPVLSNYGSTEVGNVAGWSLRDVESGVAMGEGVGRIYPGVEVAVCDEEGRRLPDGAEGGIHVRSGVATRYVDTEPGGLIRDDWIFTGDIGKVADGILYLSGRDRELIKPGGFQVWPSELETVLRAHPWVSDVAVAGVPDQRLGEIPKAYVVPTSTAPQDDDEIERTLVAYCREKVAHFKAIKSASVLASLPRTDTGKVSRQGLDRHVPDRVGPKHA